jgi:hypothetical protein
MDIAGASLAPVLAVLVASSGPKSKPGCEPK